MSSTLQLAALLGDGIGPEIVSAAVEVAKAALQIENIETQWLELPVGHVAIDEFGQAVPDQTLKMLEQVDGWILGPHDSASYPEPHLSQLNPSGSIRKHFDLFANIRPAKHFPGTDAMCPGTDLVIVRENTEGFYADRNTHQGTGEFMPTPDVAIAMGIITRKAVERIAHVGFRIAMERQKKLTIVHKANVLKLTTGLFRDVCYEIAEQYPEVSVDDFHIDAVTVHLLRRAPEFDVLVTENMFGDILSDMTGQLAGSLGIAPSINASADRAMAQAAHGSAPDIAGQGVANPVAMMLSTAMLLEWLSKRKQNPVLLRTANLISQSVSQVVGSGTSTPDMGGSASTMEFATAVVAMILTKP